MTIYIDGMRSGYEAVCKKVLAFGQLSSPRGMRTRELLDQVIVIKDPTDSIPVGTNRGVNVAVSIVEGLQQISGTSYPDLLTRVAPNMKQFMDGGTFHGTYGVRMRGQLAHVVDRLERDRDTRQAVITIWDPREDLLAGDGFHDYPCTVMQQFLVRDHKLIMHVTMRSNDVWWGLANDVGQFTLVQLAVANALGLEAGPYHHHVVSLHAYERDWESIASLKVNDDTSPTPWAGSVCDPHVDAVDGARADWWTIEKRAKAILDGDDPCCELSESERWMLDRLAKYRAN